MKEDCFVTSHVRIPNRFLLIPVGEIKGDKSLSGVLVEKDRQGRGLSTKIEIPDLSKWKQNDAGVYVSKDGNACFVSSNAYEGKSFENDRIVHAVFSAEGAEIYAKTARDAGKTSYNWLAERMKNIAGIRATGGITL